MTSLLIEGARVVTMDARRRVLDVDVLVRNGQIAKLGKALRRTRGCPKNVRVIDARDTILLPGLVQTHVHLCQALFRGMADDLPLLDWLRRRVWPLEAAHTERSLTWSAELGIAELLLSGTTAILDMGTVRHHDAVFSALARSGIRAWSGKAMMDRGRGLPPALREKTRSSLEESDRLLSTWHGEAGGRLHYAYAPRFLLSCSEGLVREVAVRSRAHDVIVHSHASEHPEERKAVRQKYGTSDVQLLARWGAKGPRTVLAHGVQLTERDMRACAKVGTRFVHCPSANLKLGSGIAPVERMHDAGMLVGLGSDGAPCNNRMDVWTQLREAALLAKGRSHDARALPATRALEMATIDGATVLGAEDQIGSVEEGKRADFVLVEATAPHLLPPVVGGSRLWPAVAAQLVYGATSADVRDVFVEGRALVRNRMLAALDVEAIVEQCNQERRRISRRAGLA